MHRLMTRRDLYCYLAIPLAIYVASFAAQLTDKPPALQPAALTAKTLTVAHSKPTPPQKTEEVTVSIPLSDELVTVLWEACEDEGVPAALALAVMEQESGFEVEAVSPSGCYGLMQLNPEWFPIGLAPEDNIRAGVWYLGELLAKHESVAAAVTEYFWGPSERKSSRYSDEVAERAEKWHNKLKEKKMLYRIERITNCAGEDREDGKSLARIGREGHLMPLSADEPMAFVYAEPHTGTLVTSGVVWLRPSNRGLTVRTRHSIYYLSEVEARDNVWPEPIELEVEDETV